MIHFRTPAEVLLTPDHKMRAAWRLLLFVTVVALSLIVVSSIEYFIDGLMMARGYVPIVTNWGIPVAILITTTIMLKSVEGTGWSFVWLGKESFNATVMARGAMWGLAAIAVPSLILIATGELREVSSVPGSWWAAAGLSLANLLPAAASEELLLRGYVFAVLKESVGWRWTLIATSIVFGLLHIPNPGSDAQSITLVMLAGFFLGSI
ncbi:MAG: CPBP family intramembrane glutamic endopeptidase, partial [Thermoanaerobaculia bacterium]